MTLTSAPTTSTLVGDVATRMAAVATPFFGGELPVRLRTWDGSEAGPLDAPVVVVRDDAALRRLVCRPGELGLAQAYVTGEIDVEGDLLEGSGASRHPYLRADAVPSRPRRRPAYGPRAGRARPATGSAGPRGAAARPAALGLHEAKPGHRHLDIGCGWGSLSLHAAAEYGVQVVGVTIAGEQKAFIDQRVTERGLGTRVDIRLQEYRDVTGGPFDTVSSIEMGEHVGERNYPVFAGQVHGLHAMRKHYVRTVDARYATFEANWDRAVAMVGEEVAGVWRLYLVGGALAFEEGRMGVDQLLVVKPTPDGRSSLLPVRDV